MPSAAFLVPCKGKCYRLQEQPLPGSCQHSCNLTASKESSEASAYGLTHLFFQQYFPSDQKVTSWTTIQQQHHLFLSAAWLSPLQAAPFPLLCHIQAQMCCSCFTVVTHTLGIVLTLFPMGQPARNTWSLPAVTPRAQAGDAAHRKPWYHAVPMGISCVSHTQKPTPSALDNSSAK